jgi:hypothetical protein
MGGVKKSAALAEKKGAPKADHSIVHLRGGPAIKVCYGGSSSKYLGPSREGCGGRLRVELNICKVEIRISGKGVNASHLH